MHRVVDVQAHRPAGGKAEVHPGVIVVGDVGVPRIVGSGGLCLLTPPGMVEPVDDLAERIVGHNALGQLVPRTRVVHDNGHRSAFRSSDPRLACARARSDEGVGCSATHSHRDRWMCRSSGPARSHEALAAHPRAVRSMGQQRTAGPFSAWLRVSARPTLHPITLVFARPGGGEHVAETDTPRLRKPPIAMPPAVPVEGWWSGHAGGSGSCSWLWQVRTRTVPPARSRCRSGRAGVITPVYVITARVVDSSAGRCQPLP